MKKIQWLSSTNLHFPSGGGEKPGVCTADAVLSRDLEARGIPHHNLWRFVTLEDQLQSAEGALQISDTWLDPLHLSYAGADVGKLFQTTLLYTFRDALLAQRIAANYLDHVASQAPMLLLPVRESARHLDLLLALLRWTAERRGVPVRDLPAPSPSAALSPLHFTKQLYHSFAGWHHRMGWGSGVLKHEKTFVKTVLLFGGGADFVNQRHIARALREQLNYRALQVNLSSRKPQPSAYSRSQDLGVGEGYLQLPVYSSPWSYAKLLTYGRRSWHRFRQWAAAHPNDHPALFQNRWLSPMLRAFFLRALPAALGAFEVTENLLQAYQPDLIVLNNDADARSRTIVHTARNLGIPSLLNIHSGVNDLHFRRPYTDHVFVWGETHRQQMMSLGFPEERVTITGNPNYDYIVEVKATLTNLRARIRRQLNLQDDTLAILLTSARSPYLLTFIDMLRHLKDLEALATAVQTLPNVRLIVKPHPRYDDISLFRPLAERFDRLTIVEDILLDQLLPACDVAVMLNVITTAGIEALLMGIPLVWINPSVKYPPKFSSFDRSALTISSRDQIAPVLRRLCENASYREAVAEMGQAALPSLVDRTDGTATRAFLDEIERLLSAAGSERRAGKAGLS